MTLRRGPGILRVVIQSAAIVAGLMLLAFAGAVFLLMQPLLGSAPRASSPAVDEARLRAHVLMLSQTLHPRSFDVPQNLDRAGRYIRDGLAAAGARASEQEFDCAGERCRNVIGSFGPEGGPRVVVGAHYDAVDGSPGADDNASGVAVLLELARLWREAAPPVRIDLVAFTLEEPPFFRTNQMGSAHHAGMLRREGIELRAMISVEAVGYFSDAPDSQTYPVALLRYLYPSEASFIAVVGRTSDSALVRKVKRAMKGASPLPVYSLNAPAVIPGVDFSDHLNYWAAGYAAVMITDTAFFRNPHYHEPTDTADTLDYARLAQVVQGVHAAALDLAR